MSIFDLTILPRITALHSLLSVVTTSPETAESQEVPQDLIRIAMVTNLLIHVK